MGLNEDLATAIHDKIDACIPSSFLTSWRTNCEVQTGAAIHGTAIYLDICSRAVAEVWYYESQLEIHNRDWIRKPKSFDYSDPDLIAKVDQYVNQLCQDELERIANYENQWPKDPRDINTIHLIRR